MGIDGGSPGGHYSQTPTWRAVEPLGRLVQTYCVLIKHGTSAREEKRRARVQKGSAELEKLVESQIFQCLHVLLNKVREAHV